jgi:ribose transport system permease protein
MGENYIAGIVKKYKIFFILLLVMIICSFISPLFLTVTNITNIFKQIAANAILAAGVCFVILTGGIDISIGSIVGYTGAVAAYLVTRDVNVALVTLAAVAIGAAIGAVNGVLVANCGLQPMIVTLGMLSIFRGATYVFTNGRTISIGAAPSVQAFKALGSGMLFDRIPISLVVVAAVYALSFYILQRTKYGRHIYAVGGNEEAARLSGINVNRTKLMAYTICGAFAAVGGVIVASRISSAQPTAGQSYEMDAIAAVVIGGTSLRGGEGHVLFTIVGAITIGMINNMLNLLAVSSYYQISIKGLVIIIAVLLDAYTNRAQSR